MKSFIVAAALSLASMAASSPLAMPDAPIGQPYMVGNQQVVHYTAKFDDETAGTDGAPVPNPAASLGPYDGAYYGSISVISQGATGVRAFSAPNFIVMGQIEQQDGTAFISADYDDSITDHFAFNYMYFGCAVASEETEVGVAEPCDITVTGYRNQEQVTSQIFTYSSGLLEDMATTPAMTKATFNSGFQDVDRIVLAVNGNEVTKETTVIVVDNIDYYAYLKQGSSYSG